MPLTIQPRLPCLYDVHSSEPPFDDVPVSFKERVSCHDDEVIDVRDCIGTFMNDLVVVPFICYNCFGYIARRL